jgi:hypothetical protein
MSPEDKEYLRALYAGMAMTGWIMNGDYSVDDIPRFSVKMADALIAQLEHQEEGIVKARKKRV